MRVIEGKATGRRVPVVYTAHHASDNFGVLASRVGLTQDQRKRFSDYGTAETVPTNGLVALIAEESRGVIDLNRGPNDPRRFPTTDFGKPEPHAIWLPGQEPTSWERRLIQSEIYEPFHNAILEALVKRGPWPSLVVAWDNTAHYQIGTSADSEPVTMQPIILSNRGAENTALPEDEPTSCDPYLLQLVAANLSTELRRYGLAHQVYLNLVYKGGYIASRYSTRRNRSFLRKAGVQGEVQSFQVEYDTLLTHNQATLEPNKKAMSALRMAFQVAIRSAWRAYNYA